MFGLVYCFLLCCCDTTPHSRTGISINLTWKAASLCLFARVPPGVYSVPDLHDSHRWHWLPPLHLCVSFTLGPSAPTEHPWTTAVTPWEKRPVAPAANWSASSRTNWYKEILVTDFGTQYGIPIGEIDWQQWVQKWTVSSPRMRHHSSSRTASTWADPVQPTGIRHSKTFEHLWSVVKPTLLLLVLWRSNQVSDALLVEIDNLCIAWRFVLNSEHCEQNLMNFVCSRSPVCKVNRKTQLS